MGGRYCGRGAGGAAVTAGAMEAGSNCGVQGGPGICGPWAILFGQARAGRALRPQHIGLR